MLFFFGVAIIGAIALAIAVFAGGDEHGIDHGDGGSPGLFNLKTISLFLLGTGAVGGVVSLYTGGIINLLSTIAGGLGGLLFAAGGFQLLKLVYRQQASSLYSIDELLGKQAQVTIAIPKNGIGQVTCDVNAQSVYREARAKDHRAIPVGEAVYIADIEGGLLVVERWEKLESGRG